MSPAAKMHREAMDLAASADLAKMRGDYDASLALYRQAYEAERAAAAFFTDRIEDEPNRSVLHRSAASLAMDCGEYREAERLLAIGLAGEPPAEIADEIRDLLEQVHFQRHLDTRGLTLEDDELQLSISGSAVGFGVARSEEFVSRVHQMESLLFRTVERRRGRAYREGGGPARSVRDDYEVYMSAPRAASFAVSLRIGRQKSQPDMFPEMREGPGIVTDLLDCLVYFNEGNAEALRERIPEPPYFRNFVGLAKQLAPDGEAVRLVGITGRGGEGERRVALTRPRGEIKAMEPAGNPEAPAVFRTVTGHLRFADAVHEQHIIQLVDEKKKRHRIIVPEGMMSDIVKPLWDDRVTVTGRVEGKTLVLADIKPETDAEGDG